ncbi:MAG: GCN5-related N-acetyltransferase [Burkholderiaceae bacterium]|nr:GCN5-related N-acetyltransferase [Burkholderiaceae bacterium]
MHTRKLNLSSIKPLTNIDEIRSLLAGCGLPVTDISNASAIQFYGIEEHGKAVAVIGLEKLTDVGLLRSLTVAEAFRGQGLAQRLVAYVERMALDENLKAIYLLTQTAAQFFEKLGFTPLSRSEAPAAIQTSSQFSCLCPDSAALLRKPVKNLEDGR